MTGGATSAWDALNDNVTQPDTVPTEQFIYASELGKITRVGLTTKALNGETPASGSRAWFYGNVAPNAKITVDVIWNGRVRATTTISGSSAGRPFAWRSIRVVPPTQAAIDSLGLRFKVIKAGAVSSNVRAGYFELQTTGIGDPSEIFWDASADTPGSWNYNYLDPGPEVASTTERSGRPWMTERVTSVVAEGTYASRFETRGGDFGEFDDPACNCERAEIAMGNPGRPGYETITADGTIRYYGFMVYVPASTVYANWQVLFQSKSNAPAGWPETSLIVRDNQFQLDNNDEPYTWISTTPIAPATKDVWHRFVIGIKYHPSYSAGFQEVWHAEGQTTPMTLKVDQITHTKEAGKDNHVRWGNYHSPQSGTSIIYHDGMRAGTSALAVAYGPIQ